MTSLNLATFDVETTRKCPVGSNSANPYWPENKIVLCATKKNKLRTQAFPVEEGKPIHLRIGSNVKGVLIGHNIGFDLGYMMARFPEQGWKMTQMLIDCMLWDTQLAAYILSAQQKKWASLDQLSEECGLPLKDSYVKDAFAAGKGADEINFEKLSEYCIADVDNTATIAERQMTEAVERGIMPLMKTQMDALAATIEMTHNGLCVDRSYTHDTITKLTKDIQQLEEITQDYVSRQIVEFGGNNGGRESVTPLDPFSPTQLSKLLFGGVVKDKVKEQVGTFKNGKPKTKTVEKERHTVAWFAEVPVRSDWVGASGVVSTNDEVLQTLLSHAPKSSVKEKLINNVLKHRELIKLLSTYFEGVTKLVMPDGLVHHKLNHTNTVTGRLSGSEPNMQNQTSRGEYNIKKAFVSRWGADGVILEADYKQLELVALAFLTQDPTLIDDILSGKDIHTELFLSMHGRKPTDEERWWFKRCSFALVYGGGKNAIAKQGNTTVEEASRFITTFYTRYPKVQEYHEAILAKADDEAVNEGDKDKETGLPVRKYYHQSVTGRVYAFREYPNSPEIKRWKKRECSFSPTELKNYPVQGLATGDIVPMMLGKMLRVLKNNPALADKCLMINTVHDSIVFDVHRDVLDMAAVTIKDTLEKAPAYFEDTFKTPFTLPLKVELSAGPSWGELEDLQ